MKTTPYAMKYYRGKGWEVDVVERWIPAQWGKSGKGGFRKDLFGFGDLLMYNAVLKQTAIVQVTDGSNSASRRNKILQERRAIEWLACGNKIFLCLTIRRIVKTKTKNAKQPTRRAYEIRDIEIVV
jgi:hypothetical protein